MSKENINGKVVLITGGTSGIGLATAEVFLKSGAIVVIAGRRESEGLAALDYLRTKSAQVHYFPADVSKSEDVQALVNAIVRRYSRLDIAFNNAGVEGSFSPIDQTPEEEFDQLLHINVKGVWLCCKYEIQQFKKQGTGGVIVNTSSWLAQGAFSGSSLYSASKAALDGMVQALAVETAGEGIRINNIQPGYIQTPMLDRFFPGTEGEAAREPLKKHAPIGRFGRPEEVGEVVVWLSSPAASFITGESLLVDGGLSIGGQRT